MKRFLHIFLLQILFFAMAGTAGAQDISTMKYSPSDGTIEHWYVFRFCKTTGYALKCDDANSMVKSGTLNVTTSATDAPDEFKWKLMESETTGQYYMVSKSGKYVSFLNGRFRLAADETGAALIHLRAKREPKTNTKEAGRYSAREKTTA